MDNPECVTQANLTCFKSQSKQKTNMTLPSFLVSQVTSHLTFVPIRAVYCLIYIADCIF